MSYRVPSANIGPFLDLYFHLIFYIPVAFGGNLIWISLFGKVCLSGFGITEIRHNSEEDVDEDEGDLDVVAGPGLGEELLLPQQELGDGDQHGQQRRDG